MDMSPEMAQKAASVIQSLKPRDLQRVLLLAGYAQKAWLAWKWTAEWAKRHRALLAATAIVALAAGVYWWARRTEAAASAPALAATSAEEALLRNLTAAAWESQRAVRDDSRNVGKLFRIGSVATGAADPEAMRSGAGSDDDF